MQSPENLKAAIDQALAVLPPEMQPKQVPPPSPVSISPTSVMDAPPACHRSASWADDDPPELASLYKPDSVGSWRHASCGTVRLGEGG